MRPLGDESSPVAKKIRKALWTYADHESEFDTVGWELYYILNGLTKERFERIIEAYRREKRNHGV